MARRLVPLVLALLLALQVIRNSAVTALAQRDPEAASRVWKGHPTAEISLGMLAIGKAARDRRSVPEAIFDRMDDAAVKAPLASEPFLVRGVRAQLAGNRRLAIAAFEAAIHRDPRSLPGHYLLAETLFRSGETPRALGEVGILARLSPGGVASLAPYVAAYADQRNSWPQLRALFRAEPQLQDAVLNILAGDAEHADTVLRLAGRSSGIWLPKLLNSLVDAGRYDQARLIWARSSAVGGAPGGLFDGDFRQANPPPPFNWSLLASSVGLAERVRGGGLHVIFYGREDGLLARQLLLLPAGKYRLSMGVAGDARAARALTWSLRCDRSQAPVSAIPLDVAGMRSWSFQVPAACPAQWLELSGVASDVARRSDLTVRHMQLDRGAANG